MATDTAITPFDWRRSVAERPVAASAPCRVDLGGTLDIKTLFLPLAARSPETFNIALDLRTRVVLGPYEPGRVMVSSRGFDSVAFDLDEAPFDHPLGLIFAVTAFFNAGGIHVDIESASPPRSALGGSSVAAAALVAALMTARGERYDKTDIVLTAHAVEEAVARVPCGYQDQLAAVFGGGNAWEWRFAAGQPVFHQRKVITADRWKTLKDCLLLAYCGIPHESRDINGQWIRHFLSGRDRHIWHDIVDCTAAFSKELQAGRLDRAVFLMNREVDRRKEMTPAVFDDMGNLLVERARERQCGARFCGAGGGGCIWALGEPGRIRNLRQEWEALLRTREEAKLLDARMDTAGLVVETGGQG